MFIVVLRPQAAESHSGTLIAATSSRWAQWGYSLDDVSERYTSNTALSLSLALGMNLSSFTIFIMHFYLIKNEVE